MEAKKAIFAGGCFWCTQSEFDGVNGVLSAVSGYTGGWAETANYPAVCTGQTGHIEAVEITYDKALVGYEALLAIYWRHIDPTDPSGQFADRGSQYEAVIFYFDEEQKSQAEASKLALAKSGRFIKPLVTRIAPALPFYPAEENHQGYHCTNPGHYQRYREGSGRQPFIRAHWPNESK
ncbi:MAG: peptide-methionine (S)-S-oxide reductase [Candidatus Lambdaproteobacteria bacterium RIFOXYD12_FULL_49_8]|uniref:Peptide methionine sulfoxide reductase MsrA n=1 Tax=Candidatus Lambdaproteobacteria bacterium RIFOXYD2_FULL_50_16 TaxID=1817772 RepID=A0A1F6GAB7_9PROT|nr:MAG: peptide-methionine (S)-S-oxide reductase [Candidatus Lambdaproteobacteria bacterium RIFOXYD2_FULL_50_16]OGG98284.1 MAG: peptide-methionine (S)-S-oxide reductase [Candidatus Lambdaproteobacteria bacterium RIFOXYD12_FULL_49_8]